jgi:pilus assembly protein CpaE
VVLNRVGSECDISDKKAEETIGKPIFWQVPNDPRAMIEARNNGVPLIQHAPKSKAHQSIVGLAEVLAGHDPYAPAKPKAAKPAGWRGIFSSR